MSESRQVKLYKHTLITSGVHSLRDFGYPNATSENIMTDLVYAMFFRRQLEQTKEDIQAAGYHPSRPEMMQACDALLEQCSAAVVAAS